MTQKPGREVGRHELCATDHRAASDHLRSFGRRRGRPLSPRQTALMEAWLPRLEIDLTKPAPRDLTGLFDASVDTVAIEIGFGGGEHLIWQAAANPTVGYIGCEPFEDGVAKVVTAVDVRGPGSIKGSIRGNIRLHMDDARDLLSWLPGESLGQAFVLFPDPWPKARHVKRRLINAAFVDLLASRMRPGARLRVATDIADYLRTALLAFRNSGHFDWCARSVEDWRHRPDDWPSTRYEQKAIREGRRCYYLTLTRAGLVGRPRANARG